MSLVTCLGPQALMIRPWPLLALIMLAGPAKAATVLSVGDGDTVRVSEGAKRITTRLACIDAPETAQAPYGVASRTQLQQFLPVGSVVSLKVQTKDRYGRTVAEIFRNGRSVNLAMVQSGQAFAYRKYLAACDGGAYLAAEAQAQQSRRGVWAVTGGIERPWDWRHEPRRATSARSAPPPASSAPGTVPVAPTAAPAGNRYTCRQIGSFAHAQELLRQGHIYLDKDGDGVACESLR
jgi:endonuclease YncB( thermonuclease family)